MAEIYTIVICVIDVPNKAPDVKYVNFSEQAVGIASVDKGSIIDYLMDTHNYPVGTKITIRNIHVFNNKTDFNNFLG